MALISHESFLQQAIELAIQNVQTGNGGPFGAVVVKDQQVVATGVNQVATAKDPTAHAEIIAIRAACQELETFKLTGCILYASCEPCPMCLAAIYWAHLEAVYFANTEAQAAAIGFDDSLIRHELQQPASSRLLKMIHLPSDHGLEPFRLWSASADRVRY